MSNPLFITIAQTAKEYGWSKRTWCRLAEEGKIKVHHLPGIRGGRLNRYEIQALLSGRTRGGDA